MSGTRGSTKATVGALALAALLAGGPVAAGNGETGGADGRRETPRVVTWEAFERLWSRALATLGLRPLTALDGAVVDAAEAPETEPAGPDPVPDPKRGGNTDPDG